MNTRSFKLGTALAALLTLGACGPVYETVEFAILTEPPVPVEFDASLITIPVGITVQVEVRAFDDGSRRREYDTYEGVLLLSEDREILTVDPGSSRKDNKFIFVAVRVGETCVRVRVDSATEDCIEVRVEPQ